MGLAFWLNLFFAAIELIGGWYFQSLAVISDAIHDFGDALSLGLGYVLQLKSFEGPSESFSYGKRRLSLLSAFISGMVISGGAIFMAIESIQSLIHGAKHEPYGQGMFVLAIFGIAVNGFAAWKLSHGHSHNEKMMRWHLIEDLLGWIAVLVGSIFIWLFHWNWLDALLGLGISAFVLFNVFRALSETINLFLQGNPDPNALRDFRSQVEEMPEIYETHDVHFWSLDGVRHILSLHAVLNNIAEAEAVKEKIRMKAKILGDCHVTIEVESTNEHCHNDCEHTHENH